MNIEDRAHEYAKIILKHMLIGDVDNLRADEIASDAWDYAEAMQAEAEKRKATPNADPMRKVREAEWQPDWSQAPDTAIAWEMRYGSNDEARWLHDHDKAGFSYSVAPTFNYSGDWKDSLRKRP